MKIVGVVAEYNPFHAGHRFHLNETRHRTGDCAIVTAMSGNFVQRGDCAIQDKWTRARAALEGGVDLVLELPTVWAVSSAEHFAWGAVNLLKEAGADALSFGSESGDADGLGQVAACLNSPVYHAGLRRFLDEGMPFAACRQAVVRGLLGDGPAALLSSPNDNLGAEYLKAANRLGWQPELIAIPRQGAGHDGGDHPEYPSASHIREQVLAGKLPVENPASLRYNERAVLARLRAMAPEDFEALPDSGEGLARRLYQAARQGTTLAEVCDLAKTKRYAHARIRRMVLWAALGLTAADVPESPPYLRVLGANERGREVLRRMKDTAGLPVITKPAHARELDQPVRGLFGLEARCTDFYTLCRKQIAPCGAEWNTNPVIL